MASRKSDAIKAEFLRSPERTTLANVQYHTNNSNINPIPVRFTLNGVPLPRNTPCSLWDPTSQEILCSTFVGDDNGVALFGIALAPDRREDVTLAAYPDLVGVTYKVAVASFLRPIAIRLIWPPEDAILPRNTTLEASVIWTIGPNVLVAPIGSAYPSDPYWDSSEDVGLQQQPISVAFPDGTVNQVMRAKFLIPSSINLDGNLLRITPYSISTGDNSSSFLNIPYWWRVASAMPARQIYITPALDAMTQPTNCTIIVTATFVDEFGQGVPGEAIRWSWQRQLLDPPIAIGDGVTDSDGRARATIHVPGDIALAGRTDILIASSGQTQTSCQITFAPRAGGAPSEARFIEPASKTILTTGQPHKVEGAFSYKDRTYADYFPGYGKTLSWSTDPYTPDIHISSISPLSNASFPYTSLRSSGMPLVSATVLAYPTGSIPSSVALVGTVMNPAAPYGMDVIRVEGITFVPATDRQLLIEAPDDGDHLPVGRSMVASAVFVDKEGAAIPDATVNWSWENVSPNGRPPSIGPSDRTDKDGRCQVTILADQDVTADLYALATAPGTNQTYHASVTNLTFCNELVGPGAIDMYSEEGSELRTGVSYEITAHYDLADGSPADGQVLTWSSGAGPIVEFDPPTSVVRGGLAVTTVKVDTRWGDQRNVTIIATTPNPKGNAGNVDKGSLPGISFYTRPVLRGVAVDKAFAASPFDGQFHPEQPATTIGAALELLPLANSDESNQVTLNLSQFGAPVHLFGDDGKELQRAPDSPDGTHNYLATLDTFGRCEFQIMSPVFSLFTLTASYKADMQSQATQVASQLVIADVDNPPPSDITSPRIQGLSQGVLTINPSSQTFRVSMDMEDADNIDDDATIVLLLNERIVFTGKGTDLDEDNGGVQIGYAGLLSGGFNELVMVYSDATIFRQRTFSTKPVRFTISGTPPSEPPPGTLKAPDGLPAHITAWNAAAGIALNFTDPAIKPNTEVTVLCFFEDSNTQAPARRNAVQFTVRAGSGTASLTIPQMYLAGYANGSNLRVFYSVTGQWSAVANATLDTGTTASAAPVFHSFMRMAHLKQEH
jgi:hypothetical protein